MTLLEQFAKFFCGERRIAKNSAKRAKRNFAMKRHGDWLALRIARVAKADVASLLSYSEVAERFQNANQILA